VSAESGREMTVLTHAFPAQTDGALELLIAAARQRGVRLRFDPEETARHELSEQPGLILDAPLARAVELCIVLGGDGTILRALRAYACTQVPVFAVNFGEVGFLATIERDQLPAGFERAFERDFALLDLPAIEVVLGGERRHAFNDVAVHRRAGERVARLAYALGGEELGCVRCDGLVAATPAGSTGYNLANGGPVMAWGVEGFATSFIAPHSLTARALVAAPSDELTVCNRSRCALEIAVDGRPVGELGQDEELTLRFRNRAGLIAQLPGYSFYGRLREKFGLLAR
jgi:NAD+ kinase